MVAFNLMSRCRPAAFSGLAPISPIDVLTMAEKLAWPCTFDEAVQVLTAMDDEFRRINAPGK